MKQSSKGKKKSSGHSIESLRFQAIKALRKVAKLVKGFLVQKSSRRIADIRDKQTSQEVPSLEVAIKELQLLKCIDHVQLGDLVCDIQLSDGTPKLSSDEFLNRVIEQYKAESVCPRVLRQVLQHKKLLEVLNVWKAKIETLILFPPRTKESNAGKKAMKVEPRLGIRDRAKAVFLDSLQDAEDKSRDEQKRRREMRNQSQTSRSQSQSKTPKQDLSSYMPPEDRRTIALYKPSIEKRAAPSQMRVQRNLPVVEQREEPQEKLHPSWLAKRQLKSKLSTIEVHKDSNYSSRNKVYFDDD